MRRIWFLAVLALLSGACGGGGETSAGTESGGEERTVLVDYKHDEFASAFLRYYPEKVKVRPGDTVTFEQAWTGEPHSVTMGKVVDNVFKFNDLLQKFDSEEDARAGGVTEEVIAEVTETFSKVPGMLINDADYSVYQPGAQPCFVPDLDSVPVFSTPDDEQVLDAVCPTRGEPQPAFNGRQGLYNSGFIAPEGESANTFRVPIAADTEPGTYKYFCNYHWIAMSGEVEVVAEGESIPSQQEVSRQGRREIEEDAKSALQKVEEVKKAKGGKVGDLELPLAGRDADDEFTVIVNEFLPQTVKARVGQKVKWTFDGITHTVSFNVPKYFPVLTIEKNGEVVWNPRSFQPVGWEVPPKPEAPEGPDGPPGERPEPEKRNVDVGEFDGGGGFRSSGALEAGETFTVTFTKPGTYPFACVLHPQMVGTLEVKA